VRHPPVKTCAWRAFLTAVCASCCAAACSGEPAVFARLRELDRAGQSPAARTALGLDLLRAEMRSPAPFDEKNPTQPSGHDWVMARVVEKLAAGAVDNRSLQQALKESHPGEFATSVRIVLALKGDPAQVQPLLAFLKEDHQFAWLRDQAVVAVGRYRDRGSVPVLWQLATRDPYYRLSDSVPDPQRKLPPGKGAVYPVRQRALSVLREWQKEGMPLESYVARAVDQDRFQFRFPNPPKPTR
jgi:hypothetical protein